ncbi:MAG: Acetyltransferase family [Oscillospiraceae bacterium]|nr:Acetyltransferase family [Oscillospiraceae bacterium]
MISLVENISFATEFKNHPQLTKIKSLYKAYGSTYDFCQFYVAKTEEQPYAGFVKFYQDIILYIDHADTLDELADFISMQSDVGSVSHNQKAFSDCFGVGYQFKAGFIMTKDKCVNNEDLDLVSDLKTSYDIIQKSFDDIKNTKQSFEQWYCDMSYRVRHGISEVLCYRDVGTATLYASDRDFGILNQVAVIPERRSDGLGRLLVQSMENRITSKNSVIYSRNDQSDAFYQKLGYQKYVYWYELQRS